jgi:hypothetical protein
MAGLPNTPTGVLAIDHRFTIGGDQNANSKIHMRYTGGPPNAAQLNALASAIAGTPATGLMGLAASAILLNEVTVQDCANMANPVGVWSGSVPGGQGAAAAMAASLSVVISYHIARRYRGGHPRGYWPLSNQNGFATPGTWANSIVTGNKTNFDNYIAAVKALTAGGVTIGNQCSVSYYSGFLTYTKSNGQTGYRAAPRATPVVDDVIGTSVNVRIGSQRRRLKKA